MRAEFLDYDFQGAACHCQLDFVFETEKGNELFPMFAPGLRLVGYGLKVKIVQMAVS